MLDCSKIITFFFSIDVDWIAELYNINALFKVLTTLNSCQIFKLLFKTLNSSSKFEQCTRVHCIFLLLCYSLMTVTSMT